MRITQPSALNDPFEMKPHFENIAPHGHFEYEVDSRREEIMHAAVSSALSNENIKENYIKLPFQVKRVLSYGMYLRGVQRRSIAFKQDFNQLFNEFIALVPDIEKEIFVPLAKRALPESINNHIGVLCLTGKPDNLLMWSHYAQNHEGFVLIFDDQHAYFHQQKFPEDELNHLRKVVYVKERPSVTALVDMAPTDLFLTKSKDWEYEEEWRMLRALKDADEIKGKIHLFAVPSVCITGIIFGCRMLEEKKQEIVQLLEENDRYSHVTRYQAVMSENHYDLDIIASRL